MAWLCMNFVSISPPAISSDVPLYRLHCLSLSNISIPNVISILTLD